MRWGTVAKRQMASFPAWVVPASCWPIHSLLWPSHNLGTQALLLVESRRQRVKDAGNYSLLLSLAI